jgi:hypothetical protein
MQWPSETRLQTAYLSLKLFRLGKELQNYSERAFAEETGIETGQQAGFGADQSSPAGGLDSGDGDSVSSQCPYWGAQKLSAQPLARSADAGFELSYRKLL